MLDTVGLSVDGGIYLKLNQISQTQSELILTHPRD